MTIIVCGGRGYDSYPTVARALDDIHALTPITMLIHGGAKGADALARRWATENSVPNVAVTADWDKYGKAAGPMRNAEMLRLNPDIILAFPGGSGTANMIKQGRAAGVKVERIA